MVLGFERFVWGWRIELRMEDRGVRVKVNGRENFLGRGYSIRFWVVEGR